MFLPLCAHERPPGRLCGKENHRGEKFSFDARGSRSGPRGGSGVISEQVLHRRRLSPWGGGGCHCHSPTPAPSTSRPRCLTHGQPVSETRVFLWPEPQPHLTSRKPRRTRRDCRGARWELTHAGGADPAGLWGDAPSGRLPTGARAACARQPAEPRAARVEGQQQRTGAGH